MCHTEVPQGSQVLVLQSNDRNSTVMGLNPARSTGQGVHDRLGIFGACLLVSQRKQQKQDGEKHPHVTNRGNIAGHVQADSSSFSGEVHLTLTKAVTAGGNRQHNHKATQHLRRKNLFHLKHIHTVSHEEHRE